MSALIVYVTAPATVAPALAQALVEARVAACVNLLPEVQSVYRWQGVVETAQECLLLIKTTEERFAALHEELRRHHPYELPELLAVPVSHASPPYLQWLIQESSPAC